MSEGQRISEAWNSWLDTDEGKKCLAGRTDGVYLRNRLERAFHQGWTESKIDTKLNGPLDANGLHKEK